MPPSPLIDPNELDWDSEVYSRAQIYEILPQQHEFAQLDRIIHFDADAGIIAGVRDVRVDEWWCRGHMPQRAIFPGVLMVECAAQLAAFGTAIVMPDAKSFMGFGGIDQAKFRDSVSPPARIVLISKGRDVRPRRTICDTQAYVDGKMVFEGVITGIRIKW
jgi:3-hydroxyacyl-[acyl-carrier-protein] dehydratase